MRKSEERPHKLWIVEEEIKKIRRRVYEGDLLVCSKCGGTMKVIAFITDYPVVDRIIDHLRLTFVADKLPPRIAFQEVLMAAETSAEYFS